YGTLAWIQILSRDYKSAIESAKSALQNDNVNRESFVARANLAYALLFDGQYEAAEEIFVKYKDADANPNQKFWQLVLGDFDLLAKAGQEPPHRAEIEKLLTPAGNPK